MEVGSVVRDVAPVTLADALRDTAAVALALSCHGAAEGDAAALGDGLSLPTALKVLKSYSMLQSAKT